MRSLLERVAAVQATKEHFAGKPFHWGSVDCAKVAAWHLRRLKHRTSGMGKAGAYDSALGAKRALARSGYDSLAAALDAVLPRVPGARALPGDLMIDDGGEGFEAIGIYAGAGAVIGFHDDMPEVGLVTIALNAAPAEVWQV